MARKTVLETINDNSLVLYYLLNKKKIKIDTIFLLEGVENNESN